MNGWIRIGERPCDAESTHAATLESCEAPEIELAAGAMPPTPFQHDLSPLLRLDVDDAALDRLAWRDVGATPGVRLAKLARQADGAGLVLYRIAASGEADAGIFPAHEHPGGEAYLVLKGTVVDEHGRYPAGSLVWMEAGSRHTPRAAAGEETLILVLWPAGVRGV
jgi:hypothetical protein